ncbi:MAG: dephospho-CoA kinase, partial [Rickettsiales bacterium]|nr:dephospho-CoA kinase [Rickettsiales bacterium]
LFPDAIENGAVNRRILGSYVFNDAQALADLELVLHPLVREAEERWLQHEFRLGTRLAVLEIQLLFETQAELLCDAVAITTAPLWLRKLRAFKRAGMSEEKFAGIITRQMTDDERRHLADWEITTALGKAVSMQQVKQIVRTI